MSFSIQALKADLDEQNPFRIVERHLVKSGLAYTILRPNFFMENFSTGFLAPTIASGEIFIAGRRRQDQLHFGQRHRRGDRHRISGKDAPEPSTT